MRRCIFFLLLFFGVEVKAQNFPYTHQTDVGVLLSSGGSASFTAQTFNGIEVDKWKMDVGTVLGVDTYSPITLLPVQAGLKFHPFQFKNIQPSFNLSSGYGFSLLHQKTDVTSKGGFLIHPSMGVRIKGHKKAAFNLTVGYKYQKAAVTVFNHDDFIFGPSSFISMNDYTFKRVFLSFGISF